MKKILLLHGWNYKNYNHILKDKDAWHNRTNFVKMLEKKYQVHKIDMPGFGLCETPNSKGWNLDDYTNYIFTYITENNLKIDYIIGYSFGGAVAINYKNTINKKQKLILLSPAIIRNQKKSKTFLKTPKFIDPIRNVLRNAYVIKVKKTNEMVYGNKFLRNTYQSIVRVDLLDVVSSFNKSEYRIIYGSLDNMVKPNTVKKLLEDNVIMIEGAGHDIANTNTEELVENINKFIS
ncbi:MAG: alpha/beta hydrolase [bacterium]